MERNSQYNNWFEELPEQCPPHDAIPCDGHYYRIVKGIPTESSDYFSQRKLQPDKMFQGEGIDECIIRSVSVFSDIEEVRKRTKLPKFRKSTIVDVELMPKDGMIKKTFGPGHYSWWRTLDFRFEQITEVI